MDQLMLPEPLVDIPSDLAENWYAVPCPAGMKQKKREQIKEKIKEKIEQIKQKRREEKG